MAALALVAAAAVAGGAIRAPCAAAGDKEKGEDPKLESLKRTFLEQKEEGQDKDAERVGTIEKFTEVKSSAATEFLVTALDTEENAGIVAAIVRVLGTYGTEDAVKGIVLKGIPLLTKSYGDVDLFEGLGSYTLREALGDQLAPAARRWLVDKGLTPAVRAHAGAYRIVLAAISRLGGKRGIAVIKKEARKVRTPAEQVALLEILRDRRISGADRIALKLIRSREPAVRVAALEVLLAVEAKKYKTRYLGLLRSKDWRVQALAIDLLAMCGDRAHVKRIIPFLESKNEKVQIAAVAALTELATRSVVEPLIKALDTAPPRVKDDIADGLARITGVDLGPFSVQWESWWATHGETAEIRRRTLEEFATTREESDAGKRTLLYHGLRVLSRKLTFIIDCSESMKEIYEPKRKRAGSSGKDERGTTVVRKKPGSKGGTSGGERSRMEVAKAELRKVLARLPDGVELNVLRFDSLITPWRSALTKLSAATRRAATKFVDASAPAGMTNIYDALETAFKDEKVDTIFLLSDGAPTNGKYVKPDEILRAVRTMNRLRKVKINTIGFDLKPDARRLLERLADENFGTFVAR